jgi:uncharacterized membrane protein YedE/YeeE
VKRALPLIAGMLFGLGVCVSGMVRPSKVLAFLNFGGAWDATLLVVMGSALIVHAIAWRFAKNAPPASQVIDARLVGGAALFGLGWGFSGYCPGPAVVSIVSGVPGVLVFVASMIVGMLIVHRSSEDG